MNDKQKAIASKFLGGDKVKTIIIIAGFFGIGLIFLSTLSGNLFSGESDQNKNELFSVKEYCTRMQEDLKETVENIQGVGTAQVLLTIENSVECVYLENSNTKTKQIEPVIRGVVVVCQGGDNPVTVQRVLSAVTKALNISSAKVCVTKSNF